MSSNGNGTAVANTARITAPGRPFQRGADVRRGHGVKGRSGRKPDWLKEFCDDLLASRATQSAVKAILRDPKHPAFAAMWKAAGDRAHGKAREHVDVKGDIAVRVVRETRRLPVDD